MIMCRSIDCDLPAEFFASFDTEGHKPPSWQGSFCHTHLLRCLELKATEITNANHIRIERIKL